MQSFGNSIFITGSTGFVGQNLIKFFSKNYQLTCFKKNSEIIIKEDFVFHLAGKAHDLKTKSNSVEYYQVNTEFTKKIFDAFLASPAKVFITLSSVKAVADTLEGELTEEHNPQPLTHYGKSKLLAEQYILSREIPEGKKIYILRPCMIHGPGNKGNLNLLYNFVSTGLPWPLGKFENYRSYLSIENLCFIIRELIERKDIPSGVYNVADDVPLSTNEVINLIAKSKGKKVLIWRINMDLIRVVSNVGDFLKLSLTSERLQKLTESYVVSNFKIKTALGKCLPISSKEGLIKTFKKFV